MTKIIEEPKIVGYKEIGGEQVPVYSCKTETVLTHKTTGVVYNTEEEATNDIADPGTSTTEEDIQRDVTIFAPRLGMGATNKSE